MQQRVAVVYDFVSILSTQKWAKKQTDDDIPTAEGETLGFQAAGLMDSPGRPTTASGRQVRISDILTLHGDRQGPILLP